MREAEMNPTADGRLRRVMVVGPDAEANPKKADGSHQPTTKTNRRSIRKQP
jgi:hypothetical protein